MFLINYGFSRSLFSSFWWIRVWVGEHSLSRMEHIPVASLFLPGVARSDPWYLTTPETSDKMWNDAHTEEEVFSLVLNTLLEEGTVVKTLKVRIMNCICLFRSLTDCRATEQSSGWTQATSLMTSLVGKALGRDRDNPVREISLF